MPLSKEAKEYLVTATSSEQYGTEITTAIDNAGVYTATIELSSAQLLALNVTSVNLLPAIIGSTYKIEMAEFIYTFGSIPYTLSSPTPTFNIVYNNLGQTIAVREQATIISASANKDGIAPIAAFVGGNIKNLGMLLILGGGGTPQLTLGDGTLKIKLSYRIFT